MNAAELREALDRIETELAIEEAEGHDHDAYEFIRDIKALADAARTIALPILEADPELVERIARRLHDFAPRERPVIRWPNLGEWQEGYRVNARLILAAISTPTTGAE